MRYNVVQEKTEVPVHLLVDIGILKKITNHSKMDVAYLDKYRFVAYLDKEDTKKFASAIAIIDGEPPCFVKKESELTVFPAYNWKWLASFFQPTGEDRPVKRNC